MKKTKIKSQESFDHSTDVTKWISFMQVEYYFSDENLPTDKYLLNLLKKDKKGFGKYAVFVCQKDIASSYLQFLIASNYLINL